MDELPTRLPPLNRLALVVWYLPHHLCIGLAALLALLCAPALLLWSLFDTQVWDRLLNPVERHVGAMIDDIERHRLRLARPRSRPPDLA